MGFLPTNGSAFLGSIHQHFGISRASCRVSPPSSLPPRLLSFLPQMKNCDSGQKLEMFIPFLGKCRPFSGRCCQTCTPKSWVRAGDAPVFPELRSPPPLNPKGLLCRGKRVGGWSRGGHSQNLSPVTSSFVVGPVFPFQDGFYHKHLSSLGFRDAIRVTEEDTR